MRQLGPPCICPLASETYFQIKLPACAPPNTFWLILIQEHVGLPVDFPNCPLLPDLAGFLGETLAQLKQKNLKIWIAHSLCVNRVTLAIRFLQRVVVCKRLRPVIWPFTPLTDYLKTSRTDFMPTSLTHALRSSPRTQPFANTQQPLFISVST